ncbi:MAG: YafY family transcriptional regulator [Gammaproteobacteria bacterium]|nr:YafY family transcriptional regulator [Gammaproteobacteria bacterium]
MNRRPTTRVLAALELLQTERRITGAELARRLDVSVRTVRRYIAALEDIGIPVTAEQGRDGAYTLVAGFKLPPMMFTDEEALALALGLLAVRELNIAEAVPAVDTAQAKLERVMPESVRFRLSNVRETVRLDIADPHRAPANVPLGTLSAAAQARRRVRLRYESPASGTTVRNFDPYGLSYQRGRWYAVGLCHLRGEMRTFRLDRIAEAVPLDAPFERPDGFDVLDFITRSFAEMPRAHAVEVVLRADLATAQAVRLSRFGLLEPCENGVTLRTRTDAIEWYAGLLAGLPFDFEIVRPPELLDAMRAIAARATRAAARAPS